MWRVRNARVSDADRMGEINVRGWQSAYRGMMPDEVLDGLSIPQRADGWRGWVTQAAPRNAFVAVGADDIVTAYCMVGDARRAADRHPELSTGELYAIYADPAHYGRGAGHAVHEAGIAHLRRHGFEHAVLWVLTDNAPGRAFYARHGWAPDGTVDLEEHAGVMVSEVRYALDLRH